MATDIFNFTKRHRIIALDLLRGFFLFVIIINHLQRFPSGFDFITGRGNLWISAAEGFVTISGILIGYIYGPKMIKNAKETSIRLFKRAGKIYLCVIALSFFFIAYTYGIAAIPDSNLEFVMLYQNDFGRLIFDSLTLQYVFGWGEFLSHYVLFLIVSPLILWIMVRYKYGFVAVLSASLLLWILSFHPYDARNRYDFTLSWQFIYIIGVTIGLYLPAISKWLNKVIPKSRVFSLKVTLYVCAALVYVVSLYLTWGNSLLSSIPVLNSMLASLQQSWDLWFSSGFSMLVDKTSLGPLRIVFGGIIFWALYLLFSDYDKKLPKPIFNLFKTLGEKSLFVYGLQAFVVFFTGLYVLNPTSYKEILILNTGVTAFCIIGIYYITKNTASFKQTYKQYLTKIFKKLYR